MLRVTAQPPVQSVDELDAVGRAQLEAAGRAYDGESLTADQRLAEDDGSETSWRGFCHRAEVFDGDTHMLDAWFYMVDSGAFFRAGTTEMVAGIVQFGIECEDRELRAALAAALEGRLP